MKHNFVEVWHVGTTGITPRGRLKQPRHPKGGAKLWNLKCRWWMLAASRTRIIECIDPGTVPRFIFVTIGTLIFAMMRSKKIRLVHFALDIYKRRGHIRRVL